MFHVGHRAAGNGPVPASALDALLATEQEIAEQLAAAEREAAVLTSAAHTDAEAIARDAAISLAAEVALLGERDGAARDALVRRIEDDAERLIARYRTLPEPEIERLAARAVADITGLDDGSPP